MTDKNKKTKCLVRSAILLTTGYYYRRPEGFRFSRTTLDELLTMFVPDKSFWYERYKKGMRNLSNPNIYENMYMEFGKVQKTEWIPCPPESATHVGLYFWDYGIYYKFRAKDIVLSIRRKEGKRDYYFLAKKLPREVCPQNTY